MKTFLKPLPEYYLLALALLAGYTPPFHFSPLAIGLAIIIVGQIIFRKAVTGLLIAALFLLINAGMLLALWSEFREFTALDAAALQLLLVGIPLFLLNTLVGVRMIKGYVADQGLPQQVFHQTDHHEG
jgi:hypothetical protein